jgi:hypothetical protein
LRLSLQLHTTKSWGLSLLILSLGPVNRKSPPGVSVNWKTRSSDLSGEDHLYQVCDKGVLLGSCIKPHKWFPGRSLHHPYSVLTFLHAILDCEISGTQSHRLIMIMSLLLWVLYILYLLCILTNVLDKDYWSHCTPEETEAPTG